MIAEGAVTIDGKKAGLGDQVLPGQQVLCNGKKAVLSQNNKIYIAFNKPYGVITTTARDVENTVMDYFKLKDRIFPIGRLDVKSTGLLMLTNDGDIVNQLSKAQNKVEKEYLVVVDKQITPEFLDNLAQGVDLEEGTTLPAHVVKNGPKGFKITLIQGWNKQIRRMCEKYGYQVISLRRLRFGKLELGDLEPGKWKYVELADII